MKKLADISLFNSVSRPSQFSVFNITLADLQATQEEHQRAVDKLREMGADAEAEAAESRAEGILSVSQKRLKSSIKAIASNIVSLRRTGAMEEEQQQEQEEDSPSEQLDMGGEGGNGFGDFAELMASQESGEGNGSGESSMPEAPGSEEEENKNNGK